MSIKTTSQRRGYLLPAAALLALAATAATPSHASAQSLGSLRVENQSGRSILQLWVTPSGWNAPVRDRLEGAVLPDGYQIDVPLRGRSCFMDVTVVYASGRMSSQENVDVCSGPAHVTFERPWRGGPQRQYGWR